MDKPLDLAVPRTTTTDVVFERLYEEISSLSLLPGARISEADIASRMGVSRQPVRDAFNRLGNMGLLLIRPQRATRVRGFSLESINNSRFIRLAVELEVVTKAAGIWDDTRAATLDKIVQSQTKAVNAGQTAEFHAKDYDFHKLICELGDVPLAFETIQSCKQSVDRLCVLSLRKSDESHAILDDHCAIADALKARSPELAREAVRKHLGRLDDTIQEIHAHHSDYFE